MACTMCTIYNVQLAWLAPGAVKWELLFCFRKCLQRHRSSATIPSLLCARRQQPYTAMPVLCRLLWAWVGTTNSRNQLDGLSDQTWRTKRFPYSHTDRGSNRICSKHADQKGAHGRGQGNLPVPWYSQGKYLWCLGYDFKRSANHWCSLKWNLLFQKLSSRRAGGNIFFGP